MSSSRTISRNDSASHESNYKHMFFYNPTPMWIFDLQTLDFLEVNDAALEHYGYTREEWLSMNARDIRPAGEIDALMQDVNNNSKGKANFAGDWLHKKKNGEIILVNIISHALSFNGREARHVMATDVTEQRRIEYRLRSSEERFRIIVEAAPDPIFIQVDGRFTYVNKNTIELFKANSEEDLLNRFVVDFIHPDSKEIAMERIHRINTYREAVKELVELRFRALDGSDVWVETAGQPIEYEGKRAGLVFVRNITNRKRVAEEISYQEYLLKEMGRIARIGGWEFDPVTGQGSWTDEVAMIHGMDPAEETNMEIGISFYTEESRKRIVKAINDAVHKQIPYDLELELVLKNGTHRWVESFGQPVVRDGKVVKVRGSFQDITERKLSERALIESEQRYRAFFANSLDAMILSSPDGQIYEVNQATCQMLGYTEEELKNLRRQDIVDPKDENLESFLKRRAETGIAVGELRFRRKDGKVIETELSSAIFLDAENNEKTSMIIRDISERKRSEQKIRQLNARLEEKIEERTAQLTAVNKDLEAFAYSVSHDLRTPLRGINGLTQILEEKYAELLDEEGARLTGRIRANSSKMGTLIEDLLSFSRASTADIRKTEIDMNLLVKSAIAEFGEKERLEKIEFVIDKLPSTVGDEVLLKQVWINLISNSVKFTSRKGNPRIEISGYLDGSKNCYKIKDNGAGFNMAYADKLFTAFQRLHAQQDFQGTGAGLSIVQRIILKHGGKIWAYGEEDKGAEFTFCLPKSD